MTTTTLIAVVGRRAVKSSVLRFSGSIAAEAGADACCCYQYSNSRCAEEYCLCGGTNLANGPGQHLELSTCSEARHRALRCPGARGSQAD